MNEIIFRLVFIGLKNTSVAEYLCNVLTSRFVGSRCVYEFLDEVPRDYYDIRRRQYRADLLINFYAEFRDSENEIIVAVVNEDGYVPGLNFVFGLADPVSRVASVYLKRLYKLPDLVDDTFIGRLRKEIIHEIGHVLGLGHCRDPRCVMSFSNSIFEVDYKTDLFCSKCLATLIKRGIEIRQ
jgi:archaemetzincin